MRCALVSTTTDLRKLLGAEIARIADRIELVDHAASGLDADVRMALAWHPAPDAFERYPNLQAVSSTGAGVDSIVSCPSLKAGVDVVRVVDPEQARMMAGFVAWHVINHQRRFDMFQAQQRERVWRTLPQRGAASMSVGILGFGAMGQCTAQVLGTLGFPVMAWSRTARSATAQVRTFHGADGLTAMLGETDVLVSLLPLTAETVGILDRRVFASMRRGGYLIQVGRGEHQVDDDLLAALASGQLAGAALDVFNTEPLPAGHPYWTHPNVVVTPHDACDATPNAVATNLIAIADALHAGVRPPHVVDRERGY
jgi:glyoxylate/hydroxypyruvate reductase A